MCRVPGRWGFPPRPVAVAGPSTPVCAPPESAELLTRQCHAIALTRKDALVTTPPDANRHAQMIHEAGMAFLQ